MKKNRKITIYILVALAIVGAGVGVYLVFFRKKDPVKRIPLVDFDGFTRDGGYTVGSDARSGDADEDGFYKIDNICQGLGMSRDVFELYNPELATLDQLLKGIIVNYPVKQIV